MSAPDAHQPSWIDLDGAANVRDLGGRAGAGRRTRHGVLLRADALDALSAADVEELAGRRGLRHVVDLRSDGERAERGRGLLGSHPAVRYTELQIITEAQLEQRRDERARRLADGTPTAQIMAEGYAQLLDWGAAAFVTAFKAIAIGADGWPALVHCSAGKDRTGVLVALLLGAADVDRDDIVADYAATAQRMAGVIERLEGAAHFTGMATDLPAFTFDAQAETMARFLDHLEQGWGGPRGWLVAHGIDQPDLDRWRATLLEPTP